MSRTGARVAIRRPIRADEREFLSLVAASRDLHHPWVSPPADRTSFREYVDRPRDRFLAYALVRVETGALAGIVNASEIVRGVFQSAYLGYYAFAPSAGTGLFFEGMALVLSDLFREQGLHRVEANIRPENTQSRALVRRLGFRREGLSPRYLKISGRWRDHERWALLAEEWKPSRLRPPRIYHITSAAEAAESGDYRPAGFSADGFTHCSYARQLTTVARLLFRGRRDLVLLEIDRRRLTCPVVDENLEGEQQLFPHVYGPLPSEAVVAIHQFPCNAQGSFELPRTIDEVWTETRAKSTRPIVRQRRRP